MLLRAASWPNHQHGSDSQGMQVPEGQSLDQIPPGVEIAETGSRSPGPRCLRKKAEPVC